MSVPKLKTFVLKPREQVFCVYFLYRGKRLQYIGHTSNLRERIMCHKTCATSPSFGTVKYFTVLSRQQARAEESRLIRELRPPFNKRNYCGGKG